jgi:hypothetical protein
MPNFRVRDVDIVTADRETLSEVATLLFRHGAIVLRRQLLDRITQLKDKTCMDAGFIIGAMSRRTL